MANIENRQRIYSFLGKINDDDRTQLCCMLIKAGYVAKIGKEREGNKGSYTYYVEYWRED